MHPSIPTPTPDPKAFAMSIARVAVLAAPAFDTPAAGVCSIADTPWLAGSFGAASVGAASVGATTRRSWALMRQSKLRQSKLRQSKVRKAGGTESRRRPGARGPERRALQHDSTSLKVAVH